MTSKKDFERILERYLNGTATEQEIKWVEKWYSTLDSSQDNPVLNERDEKNLHHRDWEDIQKRIGKRSRGILFHWPYLAAASVTLIIGVVFIYSLGPGPTAINLAKTETSSTEREIVNESSEIKILKLPDSSSVFLHPHSMIRISADFNKGDRVVSLKGEAFFDVVRNESRPFKVYTHDVISTVLGTSFLITAPSANEKIIVAVKTGRVAVSSNAEMSGSRKVNQEVIVTPNQQAVFNPENKVLKATLVQNPVTLPQAEETQPTRTKEIFDEEPISNILQNIERMYGIQIEYDEAILSSCRITTAFLNEDLYERLDILSKAIGGTYRVEGTQIIFQSKGCVNSQ